MKYLFVFIIFLACSTASKAQTRTFEIKVITKKFKSIKGLLKKVSEEGIGVEDYQGNYIIYRPEEILRLKVRKRGLTVGRATLGGAAIGGAGGLIILSSDKDGDNFGGLLVVAATLTGSGAVVGGVVGVVSEIANNRLLLNINEDPARFKQVYKKLLPYVDAR